TLHINNIQLTLTDSQNTASFGFYKSRKSKTFAIYNSGTMNEQQKLNYNRIAEAIEYIKNNFKDQPNLDEIAKQVHLSPFHFQRLFSEWAGTTPKKFLQYISLEHAKKLLKTQQ